MFAGLPGIGVGTLFYVLIALWMPIREIAFIVQGRSSLARWRLIGTQLLFAAGIMVSVALADRLLLWVLGGGTGGVGPAHWISQTLGTQAPESVMAAPIAASLVLLAAVLGAVQVGRLALALMKGRPREPRPIELVRDDRSLIDGA